MGKRKRTPTKRVLTKISKRSVGRPRIRRPKVDAKSSLGNDISNANKMTIVLLAKEGASPSKIAGLVGCDYKTAVSPLSHRFWE